MGLWGRVKQAFSATPETGTYELTPETVGAEPKSASGRTLEANIDGWRSEHTGRHRTNWSASAWDVYRYTPEVRAAVDWRTRAMSRVKLFAAWIPEDGGDPQPIEETAETKNLVDPVRELFGGPLQQATVLQQWERYRLVAGECIVAAVRPTIQERQQYAILDDWVWMVRDASIATDYGTITLTWETARGAITRQFDVNSIPNDVIYRHERVRDPANPTQTDSPTRAVMDDAEIITNVSDSINAMSMSRIATAQMLVVSSDVTIPGYGGPGAPDDEDPVMAGFVDTMGERVRQRREPISRVPLVFRTSVRSSEAPVSNAVTTIDTTTKYDEHTLDILDWESRRIAIAFNVPAEVTNGTTDPNHWNAVYEGMDGARIVIAPDAADFCRMVTEIWYQWQLVTRNVPVATIKRATVWYDASALVQDPDRSATLIALRRTDPETVTGQEVRRAVGLPSEPDEPDFAPPRPVQVQRPSQRRAVTDDDEARNGAQAAVPSIPGGGKPIVRNPGFPSPPVALANGGARRA